jgi:hypothetical protein
VVRRDTRPQERGFYRIAVGCAHLALAAMLVYGILRYFALIPPRYGQRFAFVAVVMAGVAVWMGVRGVLALMGRSGERG